MRRAPFFAIAALVLSLLSPITAGAADSRKPLPSLIAFDLKTGAREWGIEGEKPGIWEVFFEYRGLVYVMEAPCRHELTGGERAFLVARDARNGRERWRVEVAAWSTPIEQLGAGSNTVFAQGMNGKLQALNARTGEVEWETALTRPEAGTPDVVVLRAGSGLKALDRETGNESWRFGGEDNLPVDRVIRVTPETAVIDGRVFRGIDLETGRELWRWPTDTPLSPHVNVPLALSFYPPVGNVGPTAAYDMRTLEERWSKRFTSNGNAIVPALTGFQDGAMMLSGTAFPSDEQRLIAVEADDGSVRWDVPDSGYIGGRGDIALTMSSAGYEGRDVRTGEVRWATEQPRRAFPGVEVGRSSFYVATGCGLAFID